MKRILLFSAAVLVAASTFTSCKKSYRCDCLGIKGTTVELNKSDAKTTGDACKAVGCTWVTE